MFIHDLLKIKYVREGFLPDYPYHLISDEEMFEAFINDTDQCYMKDHYPCISDDVKDKYDQIVEDMKYHIQEYLDKKADMLPYWVYSYMIGAVIGPNSHQYDVHDLLVSINLDNMEDEFNTEICNSIYRISRKHVSKLKDEEQEHRHPAIYGEPHVIKLIRLDQADL